MVVQLTASQAVAQLVKERRDDNPGEPIAASWEAVKAASPALYAKYAKDHEALTEDAPVDVRFAEAVNRTMLKCGLSGTAGREAATRLLADAEPKLAAEYARSCQVRL